MDAASVSPFSPGGEGAQRADEGATVATKVIKQGIRKHSATNAAKAGNFRRSQTEYAEPAPPSSDPSGHLLPAGEKGTIDAAATSPFSPRGEGAQRADEGATGATKIVKQDIRKRRPSKTAQARTLRRNETEEEYHLWSDLRARRLNGYKFSRQVPLGPFIVDFLCREERLVVEVDGFQHADSASDNSRTKWLNSNGYSVLRFWNPEISRERRSVLETILAALRGTLEADPTSGFYLPAAPQEKHREQQP